jgi:hypothetical protein
MSEENKAVEPARKKVRNMTLDECRKVLSRLGKNDLSVYRKHVLGRARSLGYNE